MEPIRFQLMCMNKALEVRNCARKVLRSFDTGIVKKLRKFQYNVISTMFAESPGTLPVIYAVDEQKTPLPVKQCCVEVIEIALEGK